jgi:two-component system cell cycle sensor histidine kinase/response regulator CckA
MSLDMAEPQTILVVDDEPSVLDTMAAILEAHGYAVLKAAGGEEAIRVAKAHAQPIALLLADVVMPGLSGPEVAEQLRASRPQIRALYMSGFTTEVVVARGVRPGDPVLVKPIGSERLVGKIREMLEYRSPFARRPDQPGR